MNVEDWLGRSRRSLLTAETVLPDDPDAACSRAYYAMFYAARAALLAADQPEAAMGRTHAGLIAAFGERLVKPGLIAVDHGRAFAQVERERLIADYTGEGVAADAAAIAVERARAFIDAVERWMDRRSS